MSGLYTIKVTTEIAAAHKLRGYVGKCSRMHGHNWKIQAEVQAKKLNDLGIALDFVDLKGAMQEITETLDHQNLNEIPPFDEINPTAENISAWFYKQLQPIIASTDSKLIAVTIWETERCSVRYSEND